jgi:hypothetical protein
MRASLPLWPARPTSSAEASAQHRKGLRASEAVHRLPLSAAEPSALIGGQRLRGGLAGQFLVMVTAVYTLVTISAVVLAELAVGAYRLTR